MFVRGTTGVDKKGLEGRRPGRRFDVSRRRFDERLKRTVKRE